MLTQLAYAREVQLKFATSDFYPHQLSVAKKVTASLKSLKGSIIPCPCILCTSLLSELQPMCAQSHYREVTRWEISIKKYLRFGMVLGLLAILKKYLDRLLTTFQSIFFMFFRGKKKFKILFEIL